MVCGLLQYLPALVLPQECKTSGFVLNKARLIVAPHDMPEENIFPLHERERERYSLIGTHIQRDLGHFDIIIESKNFTSA